MQAVPSAAGETSGHAGLSPVATQVKVLNKHSQINFSYSTLS